MTNQRLKEIEAMIGANHLIMQMIPVGVAKELIAEIQRLKETESLAMELVAAVEREQKNLTNDNTP